jgi:superfamily I DNA/RNA helicase
VVIATSSLTAEQRRIVEFGDGPLVVIAGAGTGKTRVIVERVKCLLETRPDLLPEQVLVLTYNVKAAKELQNRLEQAVGPAIRARMTVSNFHSFCHRILSESAGEAGMPPNPDVLDGIGQFLLIRDLRPSLALRYHATDWTTAEIVKFINRAKDELVSPADFEAFVATERAVFEERYGSYDDAAARLDTQGNLRGPRDVRAAYAAVRRAERAQDRGEDPPFDPKAVEKAADREARRAVGGTGGADARGRFAPEQHPQIDQLAATYVVDGAALEVMRLLELATVYRAYQVELAARGALDFGEQIAAVSQLFKVRPNLLRRWQRQFRYILVDEFQDANIAQIELIELLGRTPDRPDNVEIKAVEPLEDHVVRLTLSDGSIVVRDLSELLDGIGVFERISVDDAAFREVFVDYGTLVWPNEVDIAPETLIWDGPPPADEGSRRPEPFLRPRNPRHIRSA